MESLDLLRSIPMFASLSEDDLTALSTTVASRDFKAGAMIFALGDVGDAMYVVVRGDVNIHLPGQASQRISLKDISRGEYFGELALFDAKPRSASAVATTDAQLLELKHDTLTRYLERRPAAAMAILRTMSERLRETNELLSARAGPLIVMSQNRQSLKDRARAETDYKINLKNEVNIETLMRELAELRGEVRGTSLHQDDRRGTSADATEG